MLIALVHLSTAKVLHFDLYATERCCLDNQTAKQDQSIPKVFPIVALTDFS